jgi:prolyl-tRNA editing enzyme YbaK/EbsC (Cys-tRNA(Pro) deacylase)
MGSLVERKSVRRVREALARAGYGGDVVALAETARTAADAGRALGVPEGAIVKSLLFTVGETPALALIAGDRRCAPAALGAALSLAGEVRRADADTVRRLTGYSIGGVPPLGFPAPIATAIDPSLGRFPAVYAAAGHPYCVFATTLDELGRLTGGPAAAELALAAN